MCWSPDLLFRISESQKAPKSEQKEADPLSSPTHDQLKEIQFISFGGKFLGKFASLSRGETFCKILKYWQAEEIFQRKLIAKNSYKYLYLSNWPHPHALSKVNLVKVGRSTLTLP